MQEIWFEHWPRFQRRGFVTGAANIDVCLIGRRTSTPETHGNRTRAALQLNGRAANVEMETPGDVVEETLA